MNENDVTEFLEEEHEMISARQENRLFFTLGLFFLMFLTGAQIKNLTNMQTKEENAEELSDEDFLDCYPRDVKTGRSQGTRPLSFVCGNSLFTVTDYDDVGSEMLGGLIPLGKTLSQIGCFKTTDYEIVCHEEGSAMSRNLHRSFVASWEPFDSIDSFDTDQEYQMIKQKSSDKSQRVSKKTNRQKRIEIIKEIDSIWPRVRSGEISKEEAKIEIRRLQAEARKHR